MKDKFLADLDAQLAASRRSVDLVTNNLARVMRLADGHEEGGERYRAVMTEVMLRSVGHIADQVLEVTASPGEAYEPRSEPVRPTEDEPDPLLDALNDEAPRGVRSVAVVPEDRWVELVAAGKLVADYLGPDEEKFAHEQGVDHEVVLALRVLARAGEITDEDES